MLTNDEEKALEHLREYGNERFKEGLIEGIRVVDVVRGWLTLQPETKT